MEELALVLSGLSFVLMIAVTFILLKRKNENTLFLDKQDKEDLVVSFKYSVLQLTQFPCQGLFTMNTHGRETFVSKYY